MHAQTPAPAAPLQPQDAFDEIENVLNGWEPWWREWIIPNFDDVADA